MSRPPLLWVLVVTALLSPRVGRGDPVPIRYDATLGEWAVAPSQSFAASGLTLDVRRFARIPNNPGGAVPRLTDLEFAPGTSGVFVVSAGEGGNPTSPSPIYHVTDDGTTVTEVLDLADVYTIPRNVSFASQQGGARAVAFHPDFATPGTAGYGKLFTSAVVERPADPSQFTYLGPNGSNTIVDGVVSEWQATFSPTGEFTGVDVGSHRELLRTAVPDANHMMGQIGFNTFSGPSDEDYGLLYVTHGNGKNGFAGSGRGGANILGKVLRIDPLDPDGAGPQQYSVPSSNPYVNDPGFLDEFFAIGLRNPHQLSFVADAGGTGYGVVGDIGHNTAEEINLLFAGKDYGYDRREGHFKRSGAGAFPLDPNEGAEGFTFPVATFGHDGNGGHAISGGHAVQNGSVLDGFYFFTDFSSEEPIFAVSVDEMFAAQTEGDADQLTTAEVQTVELLFDADDDPMTASVPRASFHDILVGDGALGPRTDIRFGQGPDGELYVMNKRNGFVYAVTNSAAPATTPGDFNRDGVVDAADYTVWRDNLGEPSDNGIGYAGDGLPGVTVSDYDVWRANFGRAASAAGTVVPEPATLLMLLAGLASAAKGRRQPTA